MSPTARYSILNTTKNHEEHVPVNIITILVFCVFQVSEDETGITDEPDLTLVSVESTSMDHDTTEPLPTQAMSRQPPAATAAADSPSPEKHSLLSFENHEESLNTESEVSLVHSNSSQNDQSPSVYQQKKKGTKLSSQTLGKSKTMSWQVDDTSYRDLYEALRDVSSEDDTGVKDVRLTTLAGVSSSDDNGAQLRGMSSSDDNSDAWMQTIGGISSSDDNDEFRALRAEVDDDDDDEEAIRAISVQQVEGEYTFYKYN